MNIKYSVLTGSKFCDGNEKSNRLGLNSLVSVHLPSNCNPLRSALQTNEIMYAKVLYKLPLK